LLPFITLVSFGLCIQGCIQDLHIDDKPYGLPEVYMSSNITTGCVNENDLCSDTASQCGSSLDREKIGTRNSNDSNSSRNTGVSSSVSNNATGVPSNSLEVITVSRDLIRIVTQTEIGELEVMRVSPVNVAEGDSVIITPRHLSITLDLSKFGIRESGVLFKIVKPPVYGRIEVR